MSELDLIAKVTRQHISKLIDNIFQQDPLSAFLKAQDDSDDFTDWASQLYKEQEMLDGINGS